jgi:hypothetical protein
MDFISSRIQVRRISRSAGWPSRDTQELVRRYFICGMCFWTTVIDIEEIPSWAVIELVTLGFSDWQSRFAEYIK